MRLRVWSLLVALALMLVGCGGTKVVVKVVAPTVPSLASGPALAQSIPYDAKTGISRPFLSLIEGVSAQPPPPGLQQPVARFGASSNGLNSRCIPGYSFPGCALLPSPSVPGKLKLAPIGGPEYPDVSDWQGHPGWGSVFAWQRSHHWHPFGVFKLGEYTYDPDASFNSTALGRAGLPRIGYWFVRNTGCGHEAGQIHQAVVWWHVSFVWLDIEVPEAHGYANCLLHAVAPYVRVGIYTGIGTWTGDSVASSTRQWNAAYNFSGPSYGNLWCSHCALVWQFTDGTYAARTFVPGVGFDDVNVDLGFERLALGGHAVKVPAFMDHTRRHLANGVVAQEYNTVRTALVHGCHLGAPRRPTCVYTAYHLRLLQDRLVVVVHRFHHGSYNYDHAAVRHAEMAKLLARR